jgi:hypothetical protein
MKGSYLKQRHWAISDGIWYEYGMDFSEIAHDFGIDPERLKDALDAAAGLLAIAGENLRPAGKKALRGVASALSGALDILSDEAVRVRLVEATVEVPQDRDEDGLADYAAWWAAQRRVARALEAAQDLLDIVRAGEDFSASPGRPSYFCQAVAARSLIDFWARDLGREVTISGHPDDPRGVEASSTVRFVHQCLQVLGETAITEQACRTILKNLWDRDAGRLRDDVFGG